MNEMVVEAPIDETTQDDAYVWVPVSELHDDPENVRTYYTDIQELAESIKSNGLLQPIVVRRDQTGKLVIIMGHRRKRALDLLGEARTKVIIRYKEQIPAEVIAAMLVENMSRVNLDPIDEAQGLQRLKISRGINDEEVAKIVGKSQPWVTNRIRLLELSPADQKRVRRGSMRIGAAVAKSRSQGGHTRSGRDPVGVLSSTHHLANRVQRRCESLNHKLGANSVGGVGCGACWEIVIRQDERHKLNRAAIEDGKCATCGADVISEEEPNANGEG